MLTVKPESNSRTERRILAPIPLEVALLIGQHLDIPSARCLARTCKALRDAGESKIWEALDVGNPLSRHTDAEIPCEQVYFDQGDRVDFKIQRALSGLASYPKRVQFVSRLRLEPSDGYYEDGKSRHRASNLIELLQLVGPRLTHLAIVPEMGDPEWDSDQGRAFNHTLFLLLLNKAQIPFPRLTHLKYACGEWTRRPIDSWMLRMPGLVDLEFCSAGGQFPIKPVFDPKAAPFNKLRRLSFDHLTTWEEEYGSEVLQELLRLAPNLESLRLRGEVEPDEDMIDSLAAAEQLRMLLVCYTGDVFMLGEGRRGPDLYDFDDVELPLEELVIECGKWSESDEPNLLEIRLPNAPSLQRLSVLTSYRPPLEQYLTAGIGPQIPEVGLIPFRFIATLYTCPHLSCIFLFYQRNAFPSIYDNKYVDPEYLVPPQRWEAEGHRGIIIRQYVKPCVAGEQVELWHVRVLSRCTTLGQVGDQRCWKHYVADGRGGAVTRDSLEKIYELSGEDIDFWEGGRNLSLGKGEAADAAWKLVKGEGSE